MRYFSWIACVVLGLLTPLLAKGSPKMTTAIPFRGSPACENEFKERCPNKAKGARPGLDEIMAMVEACFAKLTPTCRKEFKSSYDEALLSLKQAQAETRKAAGGK